MSSCGTPSVTTWARGGPGTTAELADLLERARRHPGFVAKSALAVVADVLGPSDGVGGPGDDGAAVGFGAGSVVVGGEALYPPFVEADPFGAGVAAVVANINDLAAMGAHPIGVIDTIAAPELHARQFLEGLRHAASLYGVAVLGGHLTVWEGPASASAFGVGVARELLSSRRAEPGQSLLLATCIEGVLRTDFPFFSSVKVRDRELASDIAVLSSLAERSACLAAKDVSMAGVLGSLAMLLEPTRTGVCIDLAGIPRPAGVSISEWLTVFPTYSFFLCTRPDRVEECRRAFDERGLACSLVGELDASGEVRARLDDREGLFLDLRHEAATGLAWGVADAPRSAH